MPRPASPVAALASSVPAERERAWDGFLASQTALLVRVARAVTHDHDAAMDAYAFVLERLRDHGFKRLAAYEVTDGCTFETWLAVIARRLCLDHHRHKYGRSRDDSAEAQEAQRARRSLVNLVSVAVETDLPTAEPEPGKSLESKEIHEALAAALAGLAPRDRLLLRYRFDDGLSALAITRVMKFRSVFHVYRRVNALLASCRDVLQGRGFRSTDL